MNKTVNILTSNHNTGDGKMKMSRDMRIKQMKGRIILSSAASKLNNTRDTFSNYYIKKNSNHLLTSMEPGGEYRLSVVLMDLRNPKETMQLLAGAFNNPETPGTDTAEASAAIRIMNSLGQHKKNLNEIWLLPQQKAGNIYVKSYVAAFAGALQAGAEDLFLSLDGKRLVHTLTKTPRDMFRLFQMLPYFERTEYIFHVMKSRRITSALSTVNASAMSAQEKQLFGSRRFLASRILEKISRHMVQNTVSLCAANQEAFRFLEYLAASLPGWTCDASVASCLENLADAGLCIHTLEMLKDSPAFQVQTFQLMNATGYDMKFMQALHRKVFKNVGQYVAETDGLSACMTAAWVLGREDVLAFRLSEWWQEKYEDIVLYALLHKWNRFLADFAGNEEFRETTGYLNDKCSQINANLLSTQQLIQICKQKMLPEKGSVPDWMKPATYDQILALHEIQKTRDDECRAYFVEILRKLSKSLRPETAGKRMSQFVQGWNSSVPVQKINMKEADEIASCLRKQDVYAWSAEFFSGSLGLRFRPSHALAAAVLPYIRTIPAFGGAKTEQDAWFILKNRELCKNNSLEKAKESFCQTDPGVLKLKETLKLEDAFYQKYRKESTDFFLSSTDIANAYVNGLGTGELKKFRLIVKAALCGRLNELKFHDGDLTDEIGILVNRHKADEWIHDLNIPCRDKFSGMCMEDSSFNGIMTMGTKPFHTCMSYHDGAYKECLMSYFDANKKILYRTDGNGQVIARAVLRFTKADIAGSKKNGRLDFMDVEDVRESREFPILFLERMYSGYQGKDRETLARSMIRTAKEKADRMGVTLVLAHDYAGVLDFEHDAFTSDRLSIYITKSKSSAQYLDSFGGKQTYGHGEDTYMEAACLTSATKK